MSAIVIDPEDRKQIERLADAFTEAEDSRTITASQHRVDAMRDALRSLLTPPKPAEPTGLGAVVEDADGYWWVSASHENRRQWYRDNVRSGWRDFADIAAVRVLSEGVTP